MKWKDILDIANDLKKHVEKNQNTPSTIDGLNFKEYSYLLVESVIAPGKEIPNKSIKAAPNHNGDSVNIKMSKDDYVAMAKSISKFIKYNMRLPNFYTYSKKKIDIKLVMYGFAKIIVFYGAEKRLPKTCEFNSSVFKSKSSAKKTSSKYSTKGGAICKQLMNLAKMNINTYKDVYTAIGKIFTYDYYYNDKQTRSQTISRKKGNCTDLNQVEHDALLELYSKKDVQIVRGLVRCNDGKTYGHVWCRIKVSGKWLNIDASAAAKGKPLGDVICSKVVEITDYNPSWAVSDDGKT